MIRSQNWIWVRVPKALLCWIIEFTCQLILSQTMFFDSVLKYLMWDINTDAYRTCNLFFLLKEALCYSGVCTGESKGFLITTSHMRNFLLLQQDTLKHSLCFGCCFFFSILFNFCRKRSYLHNQRWRGTHRWMISAAHERNKKLNSLDCKSKNSSMLLMISQW